MNSFNIYTLGCKVNQYDSNNLKRKLISSGLEFVDKNSQVAIINTCSVTESAISKNKRMINKAGKENPKAIIVLTGCWPKVYEVKAEDLGVDYVFRIGEEGKLIKTISKSEQYQNPSAATSTAGQAKSKIQNSCEFYSNLTIRSRYFIKIQDGCEQYCAYCVIPYARGKLKSRFEKEVIDEIKDAVDAGFREIILSGIHLGLYGKDFKVQSVKRKIPACQSLALAGRQSHNAKRKTDLVRLLKELIRIEDLGRIRLSSIEVTEVSDELIKLIASTDKICNHLHIPLQSGCDKILKLMNRPYSSKYYKNRIKKIRKVIPDIAITTDVIVGFPGETKLDFKKTYDFCKKLEFSKIHVFSFSAHEKTPASKMKDRVEKKEIVRRSKKLRELSSKLEKKYKDKFRGKELSVVIESKVGNNKYKGKTEYYFDFEFDKKINLQIGKIAVVKNLK